MTRQLSFTVYLVILPLLGSGILAGCRSAPPLPPVPLPTAAETASTPVEENETVGASAVPPAPTEATTPDTTGAEMPDDPDDATDARALQEYPSDYHVSPMDVLRIDVYGEPDISRAYHVSEAGTINHPFLGALLLQGLTLSQAQERITQLLARDYLVDPKVAVTVESSVARRIIIFGEVGNPGTYTIPPNQPMSLLHAVSLAGGFSELAARSRVLIVRNDHGTERVIKIDVTDLLAGKQGSLDVPLKPGDVITVPQSRF